MRPRIQPDAPKHSYKTLRRVLWGVVIMAVLALGVYFLTPIYIFYYVPEELPAYDKPPRA